MATSDQEDTKSEKPNRKINDNIKIIDEITKDINEGTKNDLSFKPLYTTDISKHKIINVNIKSLTMNVSFEGSFRLYENKFAKDPKDKYKLLFIADNCGKNLKTVYISILNELRSQVRKMPSNDECDDTSFGKNNENVLIIPIDKIDLSIIYKKSEISITHETLYSTVKKFGKKDSKLKNLFSEIAYTISMIPLRITYKKIVKLTFTNAKCYKIINPIDEREIQVFNSAYNIINNKYPESDDEYKEDDEPENI